MALLIGGVLLWSLAHLFKRLAPGLRSSLGAAGKGLVALAVLLSVWMMVQGYGSAENIYFWARSSALAGINNLLMLVAVYLFVTSYIPVRVRRWVKHPQLAAVKAWALAHLLVNGDLNSFILFGGLLAWAVVSVILIKRASATSASEPGRNASVLKELVALGVTLVTYGAISVIHLKLGYPVFG